MPIYVFKCTVCGTEKDEHIKYSSKLYSVKWGEQAGLFCDKCNAHTPHERVLNKTGFRVDHTIQDDFPEK